MRTIFIILALLILQTDSYSCSWSPRSFCETSEAFVTMHSNLIVVSGVVSTSDSDGVDFDVIEVLEGVESRTTLRIWDGTDFDCNGLHSMAAGDFLRVGDSLVIILPLIDSIENSWDQLGDYRMPMPWGASPFLQVKDGLVQGLILGYYNSEHRVTELQYEYFAKEYLGSGICELDLPNLKVSFYHDENQDGMRDQLEDNLPIGAITIPDLGNFENFKHSGIYIYAPVGTLEISYDPTYLADWTTSRESTFEVEITDTNSPQIRIGLIPTSSYTSVTSNISHANFRCGEDIPFVLNITNEGTEAASGSFWLEMDPRLEDYVFEEEPDYTNQAEGVFGWEYDELGPYNILRIPFIITAPLITEPDQVGEIYTFKISDDISAPRNVSCQEVELRCAFDPNDKQAFPIRADNLALKSEALRYTIRFQNTGNDFARNVVVTDTLDQGLDLSTFKLISTSHPRQLTISSGGGYDKKFEFANIFLPDSLSDEPNSHGYLTYTISANEDLALETRINNTANIYFDFNPPIVTNTVSSIMVDKFPSSDAIDVLTFDLEFYPNPATNELIFSQEVEEVVLYDLSGRLIKSASQTSLLVVSDVDEGMYMMVLSEGKRRVTKRVVVMR